MVKLHRLILGQPEQISCGLLDMVRLVFCDGDLFDPRVFVDCVNMHPYRGMCSSFSTRLGDLRLAVTCHPIRWSFKSVGHQHRSCRVDPFESRSPLAKSPTSYDGFIERHRLAFLSCTMRCKA